ncbi:integrase catalytic domain-containing protein [Trichonephila clavipes]|nr:integrase catalytic domain-containing protein [Trichonephila clavipes]
MFNLVCKPDETLASYMASEGIDWKFLPPRAPNFGGLWEAGVKSFKFYLKRVVGRSITSIVEPDLTNLNENRLDNWQKITKIIKLIWKRWSADYLNSLQQRNKWHFEKKNAKIGDMVIIKEDNLPSRQWSLGRINNIYPRKDSKSSFLVHCTTPNEGVSGWESRAAHVMGIAIPNVLQPGTFIWFEKTEGPLVKVLPVPGWLPMKQLAVCMHFLQCGSLLDNWSVEGVLSLVFM